MPTSKSGTNSKGNDYNTAGGSNSNTGTSYHYSNSNGSYYYKNDNGSSYYNPGSSGKGNTTYTSSSSNGKKWGEKIDVQLLMKWKGI